MARATGLCIADAATVKRSGEEKLLVTLSLPVPLPPLSNPDHLEALLNIVKGNSTGRTALKILYLQV